MAMTLSTCRNCGRFGTRGCPDQESQNACTSYQSWAELWAKETAAIERAQRVTYVAAALLIVLATAAVVLPKTLIA